MKDEKQLKEEYILLCVDPSLKCTGLSILKVSNKEPHNWCDKNIELLDYLIIPTHNISHGNALIYFEKVMTDTINEYNPDYVTAEQMFAGNNRVTGMVLSNIHGIMQLICAKAKLDIVYYAILTAKSQTLGGVKTKKDDGTKKTGNELKIEVSDKIIEILGESSFFKEYNLDITDSISIGLTFIALNGKTIKEIKNETKKKTKKKTIKGNNKTNGK